MGSPYTGVGGGCGAVRRPYVIGLTGNIGSGKSTVAAMLRQLGAYVIDADRVAHTVMRAGNPVHAEIVKAFGSEVLAPDGEIDRRRLARIVFADPEALRRLEALVHPATCAAIDEMVRSATAPVVVVEAIKLIEAGIADRCDSVWVVVSTEEQQIERVMAQRGLSRVEVEQRIRAQPPVQLKLERADVVIDNSGSLEHTWAQVQEAWRKLSLPLENDPPSSRLGW